MEIPVFEYVRNHWPGKALAWDLSRRPVRLRPSDARVLDPAAAIVATGEPGIFRQLARDWASRDAAHRQAAEDITEGQHQLELEQAAQPPVIEVTVTTPPEGIPRAELAALVQSSLAELTDPAGLPVLPLADAGEAGPPPRRRRMLMATRRAFSGEAALPELPVSEDDTPTQELPAVTDGGQP